MPENFYKIDTPDATSHLSDEASKLKAEEVTAETKLMDDDFDNDPEFDRVMEKIDKYGEFSLTATEHHAIGSTPDDDLNANPGKAWYEIIADEKLEHILDSHIRFLTGRNDSKPGEYEASFELVSKAIPSLKSVDRLPAKYANFDLNSIKKNSIAA